MKPILQKLGLTPEIIARFVVRIEPALTPGQINYRLQDAARKKIALEKKRAAFVAAGLTTDGKPRRRSPNGTRKVYVRKISTPHASPLPVRRGEAEQS